MMTDQMEIETSDVECSANGDLETEPASINAEQETSLGELPMEMARAEDFQDLEALKALKATEETTSLKDIVPLPQPLPHTTSAQSPAPATVTARNSSTTCSTPGTSSTGTSMVRSQLNLSANEVRESERPYVNTEQGTDITSLPIAKANTHSFQDPEASNSPTGTNTTGMYTSIKEIVPLSQRFADLQLNDLLDASEQATTIQDIVPLHQPLPEPTLASPPAAATVTPGAYNVTPAGRHHPPMPPVQLTQHPPHPPPQLTTPTTTTPESPSNAPQATLPTALVHHHHHRNIPTRKRKILECCILANGALGIILLAVILVAVFSSIQDGDTINYPPKQSTPTNTDHNSNATPDQLSSNQTDSVSSNSSSSLEEDDEIDNLLILDNLPQQTLNSLLDPFPPQSEAYHWLETHPDLDTYPQWRRRQLMALATFYYAFDGTRWPLGINLDWLDKTRSECNWYSSWIGYWADDELTVFQHNPDSRICNDKGEYTVLYLGEASSLGFAKDNITFPFELSFLSTLQIFNWRANGLSKHSESGDHALWPAEYYQRLTNLEHLNLGENSWNTHLPSEFGMLTKLTSLNLQESNLRGRIASELGLLSNLQFLELDTNQFTGSIPKELQQIPTLRFVELHYNPWLTGDIPTNFSESMQGMTLRGNDLLLSPSGTTIPPPVCVLDDLQSLPNCRCEMHNETSACPCTCIRGEDWNQTTTTNRTAASLNSTSG
ncbi:Leucine Rich Repeat [Seminavis robusta]|uniref:Leucine Rich Repeat n=1 Tax=Seminavis robusta TaxID=568900 RepID=A0A9N8DVF9_9STRA|nr:Leucine Rich Repeat [Seminavis robusta]|eukprot:Sro401_g135310.1 Leucine Rich Repeat (721) ;mRNA; f:22712-24874